MAKKKGVLVVFGGLGFLDFLGYRFSSVYRLKRCGRR